MQHDDQELHVSLRNEGFEIRRKSAPIRGPVDNSPESSIVMRGEYEALQRRVAQLEEGLRVVRVSREQAHTLCTEYERERDAAQQHNTILEEANKTAHERVAQLATENRLMLGENAKLRGWVQDLAQKDVRDMEFDKLKSSHATLLGAVVWALGYTDFRARENGEGPYWWRPELRRRAALTPEQIEQAKAALTPQAGKGGGA